MKKILLGALFLTFIGCVAPQGFVAIPTSWTAANTLCGQA